MNTILSRSDALERLDTGLRTWALHSGAEEQRYPTLIPAQTLELAEYPNAFPQLLLAPAAAADPAQPLCPMNAALCDCYLSPAVCYHAYAQFAGRTLPRGNTLTARGRCFRNEDPAELAPGRRQIEFEMRELILLGPPQWIDQRLKALQPQVQALAHSRGLSTDWNNATDPFFLPAAEGKAHLQRLLGTKLELCLPDGLAIASINRHSDFFGTRFDIRTADGSPAHSACIAFGLDRWAAQSPFPS